MTRKEQELNEMDMSLEEYTQTGFIWNDYRLIEDDLAVTCDYNFLQNLNIGDELFLISEETQNLSPFVISVELNEIDSSFKRFEVTRKIYCADSLDVYVVPVKEEGDLIMEEIFYANRNK